MSLAEMLPYKKNRFSINRRTSPIYTRRLKLRDLRIVTRGNSLPPCPSSPATGGRRRRVVGVANTSSPSLRNTTQKMTEARPRMRHHRGDSGCSRCAPGWGVISRCTAERDTQCGKCPQGTYSPHHNMQPCWICSRCGPGLYEAHPCVTGRTDTVCDSCHRVAHDNPDYRRKCKSIASFFLAPEDARNTGEESSLVNESEATEIDETERENILEEDAEAQLLDSRNFESMQRL